MCHRSCGSCDVVSNSTQCLSCPNGFELVGLPPSVCSASMFSDVGSGSERELVTISIQTVLSCHFIITAPTARNVILPFLDLGSSAREPLTGVDDDSVAVDLPFPLRFGSSTQTRAFVSYFLLIFFFISRL